MMKAGIRASLAQGVNLTPQLLQSIRLLQLTSQQLEQEIQQVLERNPLLEQEEPAEEPDATTAADVSVLEAAAWDELPEPSFLAGIAAAGSGDDDGMARIAHPASNDPRVRLLQELALHWNARDLELAAWWLDRCDDRGYLEQPHDELLAEGRAAFPQRAGELEVIRQRLLHGDWPGMAARDAGECLRAQLAAQPENEARSLADRILREHLELLAAHDEAALARALAAEPTAVRSAIALILSLRPHPAELPSTAEDAHVVPEVVAWFAGGAWRVALNSRTTPQLRIAPHCERALAGGSGADHTVLKGLLDEARWLVRGLGMRNDTLLRTAQVLVERQRGFLQHGDEALAPLTLREVADAIGMHESTVSRIVSGKYIQTPRGTFELKRLFAVRLEGAEIGGTAVRALVKRLIDAEPANAPLPDDVIAGLLARQGVRIARRTVAKYRDQLSIGPVRARQRLAARA